MRRPVYILRMVDFKQENAHLYIPKNLSYENGDYQRYSHETLFRVEALCDVKKRDLQDKSTIGEHHYSISHVDNTVVKLRKTISYIPSTSSASFNENNTDFLAALDLASQCCSSKSNTLFTKSNEGKWTKMGDSVFISKESSFKSIPDDGNVNETVLKSSAQRPQSPVSISDTDTDFSEDYMRMTDIGEGSQCSDISDQLTRTTQHGSSSSYDSSLSNSNRSSVGTLENDDMDRVTLNFSHLELSPDDDPVTTMNKHLENDVTSCNFDGKPRSTEDTMSTKKIGIVGKRLKEKELPKIKLLLSKSPPTAEMFEKGLASLPADNCSSPTEEDSPPVTSGSLFINQEFDYLETEQVKRSTSLKTYKTPPGTPHRKKVVRFADAMGLDLEDIKHVMNQEDPPQIPESAMKDLKVGLEEEHKTQGTKYLTACFPQPGANPNFIRLVVDTKVKLENCLVDGQEMTINGTVRVANIGFHKRVVLRYTVNNWLTFTDVYASYVQNSNDGATDRFSFTFGVPNYFQSGNKLQFAVMLECNRQQYWDNNGGSNYTIECYAAAVPVTETDNLWMHFL